MSLTWREAILKNFNLRAIQNQGGADEGVHEIVPGLYLSGFKEVADGDLMSRKGITHIVSLTECPTKLYQERESLVIPCRDVISQYMMDFIPRVNDYVHNARINNGKVVIHCMCGVSRGPTMTIGYLMSVTNLSAQEAYNAVISVRSFIGPNPSFRQQLTNYELCGALQQERMRLKNKFPQSDYTRNDELICRERILKCLRDPSSPFFNKFPDFFDVRTQTEFTIPKFRGGPSSPASFNPNSMIPQQPQPGTNNNFNNNNSSNTNNNTDTQGFALQGGGGIGYSRPNVNNVGPGGTGILNNPNLAPMGHHQQQNTAMGILSFAAENGTPAIPNKFIPTQSTAQNATNMIMNMDTQLGQNNGVQQQFQQSPNGSSRNLGK